MKRIFVITAIAALLLIAMSAVAYQTVGAQAEEKTLVSGWYQHRQVEYYDFGTNTPLAANNTVPTQPIWVFIHGINADGTPVMVDGQHNIVGVAPGEPGYTDLWQVVFVTVPDDYVPDSIRSAQDVSASGFEQTTTNMLVNCPLVPEGTTLETGKELVQGWHNGQAVFYPDFGANPATVAPIWVLIHGMKADGTPDFVEGQNNIIDTVPGQTDYTAFWRVNIVTVPDGYEPNSLRSAADVLAAGYQITETDMVVNCPVVQVAAAPGAAPVTAPPSAGSGGGGGSSTPWLAIFVAAGLAALALVTGGAGFAYARRKS